MKKYILITILFLQAALLCAVFDDYIPSARARGMGGAFTAVADDATAIFFNPAGLAQSDNHLQIGFSQLYNPKFAEHGTAAAAIKLPEKWGRLGLGARFFGVTFEDVDLMSEKTFSLSHGFVLQHDIHSTICMGYTGNFHHLAFDDEDDTDSALSLDLGVNAVLHGRTRFGFTVANLFKARMGHESQNELPSKLALGLAYQPYDGVTTSVELKKDFAKETEFMGGVEARIFEPLTLRFGIHHNPALYNLGLGLNIRGVEIDYSYSFHNVLPSTSHINVGYKF